MESEVSTGTVGRGCSHGGVQALQKPKLTCPFSLLTAVLSLRCRFPRYLWEIQGRVLPDAQMEAAEREEAIWTLLRLQGASDDSGTSPCSLRSCRKEVQAFPQRSQPSSPIQHSNSSSLCSGDGSFLPADPEPQEEKPFSGTAS